MTVGGIFKTYLLGWLVTPVVAILIPIGLMLASKLAAESLGVDIDRNKAMVFAPAGFLGLLWAGVVVAKIMDRSAGRGVAIAPTNHPPGDSRPAASEIEEVG